MKKTISIITAVLMLVCFSTVSAHADRKTMEGFMLGTGVAILGAAIIKGINDNSTPQYQNKHSRYDNHKYNGYRSWNKDRHYKKHSKKRDRGHWEIKRSWIEPVYETKWNPGHYNRRGDWIGGRYEKFKVARGSWQEAKVWVWH